MIALSWAIAVVGIVAVILNIKKNRLCFVLWMMTNVGLVGIHLSNQEFPLAGLFFVYSGTAVWGFVEWSKDKREVEKQYETTYRHYDK